jgi:hypothetical protein
MNMQRSWILLGALHHYQLRLTWHCPVQEHCEANKTWRIDIYSWQIVYPNDGKSVQPKGDCAMKTVTARHLGCLE